MSHADETGDATRGRYGEHSAFGNTSPDGQFVELGIH